MSVLHGGPRDGLELDIPEDQGIESVNFPLIDGTGSAAYVRGPDGEWTFDRLNPIPKRRRTETAVQPPGETR